jgi:KDO2-lipid IV(A) lauroyltransferase
LLRSLRQLLEYAAVLGIGAVVRQLRPQHAVTLGGKVGAAYARLRAPRTGDAATNLALAFPGRSAAERRRLLVANFSNIGRSLAEVFVLQGRYRDELLSGVSVEGIENYEAARSRSRSGGVIVLTAHFGSWELCAAAMAGRGIPISVVHHRLANPYLEDLVSRWRARSQVAEIRLGKAAMGVFRALARGQVVVMLLDQNARREEGLFAPFFGLVACTRSAPARIAMSRGFPVLPVFAFRSDGTARHSVRILPPLDLECPGLEDRDSEPALERNVARMNQAIEDAVRQAPDQWLWAHRRWQTQPKGSARIYSPRRRRR